MRKEIRGTNNSIDEGAYVIELSGRARRPSVEFSFTTYDFGYCFINKKWSATVAGYEGSMDIGNNKNDNEKKSKN